MFQRVTQTQRHICEHTQTLSYTHRHIETDRHTHTYRVTNKHRHTETDRRQTDRHTHKMREKEREIRTKSLHLVLFYFLVKARNRTLKTAAIRTTWNSATKRCFVLHQ